MRGLVHKTCLQYFRPGDSILELNAGTGEDAMFLAANGMNIHATDISDEMINIIRSKIKTGNIAGKVSADVLSFDDIDKVSGGPFNGAFSNFGGLNCINDFSKLSEDIHGKLKPGGIFIAVVMNKFCPWEIFYYLLKLDPKNAFRRFKKSGIMAELNGEKVKTYYFSPAQFSAAFGRHFEKIKILSLGFKTPPPYLSGIYHKLKPLVHLWMKFDEFTMKLPVFNRFGDHFIVILKRK